MKNQLFVQPAEMIDEGDSGSILVGYNTNLSELHLYFIGIIHLLKDKYAVACPLKDFLLDYEKESFGDVEFDGIYLDPNENYFDITK